MICRNERKRLGGSSEGHCDWSCVGTENIVVGLGRE